MLLHIVAGVERSVPVIFLETGKLFPETLRYRDRPDRPARPYRRALGAARPRDAGRIDRDGKLWRSDPALCCWHRKVEPLDAALDGFEAWITGRKRFQGGKRTELELIEFGRGRPHQGQSHRLLERTGHRRLFRRPRSAAAPAGGAGLPVDRVRGLHAPGARGRAAAGRTLGRHGQDGMRHP